MEEMSLTLQLTFASLSPYSDLKVFAKTWCGQPESDG